MKRPFDKILIANRSEIAVRIIRACKSLGIGTVAVYSEADVDSLHRQLADESVLIGPPPPRESYLDIDKIIAAAKETGAQAIHPGYGFLAENAAFPLRCVKEGLTFIGPSAESMRLMGNKVEARVKMRDAGVPLVPGMEAAGNHLDEFKAMADDIGYPVLIKAAAGGGGKGMRVVSSSNEIADAVDAARREALSAFGDDTVYLEKFISNPRHIEFQILADSHGDCVHLFERECSIQRRHQKIIEETPSTALTPELRAAMGADAVKVAQACDYLGAGTVEFLFDDSGHYYFLEMNTRIQVEHPITEMTTGVDLVVEQIRVAAGEPISATARSATQRGHAIECRIYAEDGDNNFMPSTGRIRGYHEPTGPGVRVDSGICQGIEIGINYDPIMAKLIVHAPDRATAITKMIDALTEYRILGVKTSRRFMIDILHHPAFVSGKTYTSFIETQMTDRQGPPEPLKQVAAAVASVHDSLTATNGAGVATGQKVQPGPWQVLGPWQIGDSIDAPS